MILLLENTFYRNKEIFDLKESWKEKDLDEVATWISKLSIPNKTPIGINKLDFTLMKEIKKLTQEFLSAKQNAIAPVIPMIKQEFGFKILGKLDMVRMTKDEIEQAFLGNDDSKETIIKKKYATYYKQGSFAYSTFLKSIEDLELFLSELKSPHNKVLEDLEIHFVDSKDLKSIANYSSQYDFLRINPKKVGNTTEDYGSLPYVVLHELGHRYLNRYIQNWDYDNRKWITTKYSETDSFSGEEKFAELFALSHWPRKYPEYKNQIKMFLDTIE